MNKLGLASCVAFSLTLWSLMSGCGLWKKSSETQVAEVQQRRTQVIACNIYKVKGNGREDLLPGYYGPEVPPDVFTTASKGCVVHTPNEWGWIFGTVIDTKNGLMLGYWAILSNKNCEYREPITIDDFNSDIASTALAWSTYVNISGGATSAIEAPKSFTINDADYVDKNCHIDHEF